MKQAPATFQFAVDINELDRCDHLELLSLLPDKYPEWTCSRLDPTRHSRDHLRQPDSVHGVLMTVRPTRCPPLAILAPCLLLIAACSKVTAEDYAKIRSGMDYREVIAILGIPASCDDSAGFKSCKWEDEKGHIAIRFFGDKAILHTGRNLR
ncbi:MAG: hypothetical protein MUE59_12720 [Thiobacillaceae bacterium]|jgi:hypothetical protein|nr:hypothetical protein [Thiobacillaceae bacterium]